MDLIRILQIVLAILRVLVESGVVSKADADKATKDAVRQAIEAGSAVAWIEGQKDEA